MSTDKVNAWMDAYDNPMKDVVQAMREVIMADDGRSVKIASLEQLEERKAELVAVVKAWIDLQDS